MLQKYEMLTHEYGEDITTTYERLNVMINQLKTFGKNIATGSMWSEANESTSRKIRCKNYDN